MSKRDYELLLFDMYLLSTKVISYIREIYKKREHIFNVNLIEEYQINEFIKCKLNYLKDQK